MMFFPLHFGILELFNCTAAGLAFLVEIRIPREEQRIAYNFKKQLKLSNKVKYSDCF